jgi:hypothetical protein
MDREYKYDIAISFAEEDRNVALAIALAVEMSGMKRVYYYPEQHSETVGKRLHPALEKIYGEESQYIVVLLSKKYFKKPTAKKELQAIYSRIQQQPDIVCVIPVMLQKKLDLSAYPYLKELTWLEWAFQPKEIAKLLKGKLGSTSSSDLGERLAKKLRSDISINQSNEAGDATSQQNNATIKL